MRGLSIAPGQNYPEPRGAPPEESLAHEQEREAEQAECDRLVREAREIVSETSDGEPGTAHLAALIAEIDELRAELRKQNALRIHDDMRYHDTLTAIYEAGRSIGLAQDFSESTRSYLLRIARAVPQGGVK